MKYIITLLTCSCFCVLIYGAAHEIEPQKDITFYQTNLVCAAATDIGCGTRAKPMLAAFVEHPDVEEAWLNHAGTIIAVVWKEGAQSKHEVANAVFGEWEQPFLMLQGDKKAEQLDDFANGKWYKGNEVDQLSLIEAERIAGQLTTWLESELELSEEKSKQIHSAFEEYVAGEFMAIEDANVIYETSYWKRWEKELTSIGKEYLGEDMPDVQIVSGNAQQECKTEKSCCAKDSKKDCCVKKEGTE